MSELDRVAQLLAARFEQPGELGRIVFWHDEAGQYADEVHALVGADADVPVLRSVELVEVGHTPFDLRYRMTRQEPDTRFLVYMTDAQPALRDDWLLDLKLAYGPLFSADKLTMIATEVLPDAPSTVRDEWLAAMRQAPRFFDSQERVERLAKRLDARDDADKFRAKMVAVLVGLPMDQHSLQDIWRALLAQYADGDSSGIDLVERMGLGSFHWEGTHRIYRFPLPEDGAPTVKGFVLWLFDLAWHGFIADGHDAVYYGNIKRDYEGWLRDRTLTATMQALAEHAEAELDLDAAIERMGLDELADRDVFDAVDRVLVDRLLEGLAANTLTDRQVQEIVAKRRTGLWHDRYEQRYEAISAASTLRRELVDAAGVIERIDSPLGGMEAYVARLYRVDQAYRHFVAAWGADMAAGDVKRMLEHDYGQYQRDLGRAWQQQVDTLHEWRIPGFDAQQADFYQNVVAPRVRNGRKLVVIVSDALRYEVAEELTRRVDAQSRFTASIEACCGVLPSYTQYGMAALLPHSSLSLDMKHPEGLLVDVDGKPSAGLEARDRILRQVGGRAVEANRLMALKPGETRELVKSCDVLYVYHDVIDAMSDKGEKGEEYTVRHCQTAVDSLIDLVRKLANANVSNMVVTADHGFLYQDHPVTDAERVTVRPEGEDCWKVKARFAVGKDLVANEGTTTFTAAQVGWSNPVGQGVSVQVPNSILRFGGAVGSGTRFVHGGASLPEIVVPVVHVNKGRSASGDVRPVPFRILQKGERITSGQIKVEFVQEEPVGGKTRERTIYAGLWGSRDGRDILISNEVPVLLDSTSPKTADRHAFATLVLSSNAQKFNGGNIRLRIREKVDGAGDVMRFSAEQADYLLRRGMIADDGFDF